MGEVKKTSMGLDQNLAGLLCYLAWWITGLIFLLTEKENQFVRFHALQSIITFGALFVINIVLGFIPFIGWLLWLLSVVLWVVLMVKAYQGQMFKLPVIGDIAEKNSKPAAK